jgi:hypothetical protein
MDKKINKAVSARYLIQSIRCDYNLTKKSQSVKEKGLGYSISRLLRDFQYSVVES